MSKEQTKIPQHRDIYVRAHTVLAEKKKSKDKKNSNYADNEPKWPDYAVIFDCESRITADQTLTFGFWRFCQLRDGKYIPLEEGIFHDHDLGAKELNVLRQYARATKPET